MVSSEYTDKLKSVKIVHDDIHRFDFSYLAEFFRFMGVLVCENILVERQEESNTLYSVWIYVGRENPTKQEMDIWENACEGDEWKNPRSAYEERLSRLPEGTIYLYERIVDGVTPQKASDMLFRLNKPDQKKVLNKLMQLIAGKINCGLGKADQGRLDDLIGIFVDDELWFHSLNLQYYAKRKSLPIESAKDAFLSAHGKLRDYMSVYLQRFGEDYGLRYIFEYAFLWCEVKVNDACDFCREALSFPIDRLANRCMMLCRKYPEFSNAKVLLGLCYAPSHNSANEALWAFRDALQDLNSECFASPIFYWIGKRYEAYQNNQEDAQKAYALANKRKSKFRNHFKLGIFARKEENYSEAIKHFQEILRKLEVKRKMNLVDPLEVEYLFKTYTQLAYVYYKQNDYVNAIKMGECVIEVVDIYIRPEKKIKGDYFDIFYGMNEAIYRNILWNRLDTGAVFKILSESCAKIMERDEAKEYQDRLLLKI